MADDGLILNIASDPLTFSKKKNQQFPSAKTFSWVSHACWCCHCHYHVVFVSTVNRYLLFLQRKKEPLKRKAECEPQENSTFKQRKINQTGQQHAHKQKLQSRSPSQRNNNGDIEETGDQRENSAAKSPSKVKTFPKKAPEEHGRPLIKTSSLFRNNPEIPDVQR